MNDINETKTALKCCTSLRDKCDECPLRYYLHCQKELIKRAKRLVDGHEKIVAKYSGMLFTGNKK